MTTTQELRFLRGMSILRRLQRGAAERPALMDHVRLEVGYEAYDESKSERGLESQFSKDIKFLREVLHILVPSVDRQTNAYELDGFGAFSPLCLTDGEMETLAFLRHTFHARAPRSDAVQALLARIVDLLSQNQQAAVADQQSRLRLELHNRDGGHIDARVRDAVTRALTERRQLQFAYSTASQSDGQPRVHTVQPHEEFFDPARGHLYLDAYWLRSDGPLGAYPQQKWQMFRMDKMLADAHLRVLPAKLPPQLPRRPRIELEYWLSPRIARGRQVTHHFEQTKTHETNDADWLRVTAQTDNLFRAVRQLLWYGPNCRVTGGAEAREEMERLVRAMAETYELL